MPERNPLSLSARKVQIGQEQEEALRPLRRLRCLAQEIEAGLKSDNIELVSKAAALLAPTLAQWKAHEAMLTIGAGEAAQLALETHQHLDRCEASLRLAMDRVSGEIRRLQQGKRTVAIVRARRPVSVGRRLDTQQ